MKKSLWISILLTLFALSASAIPARRDSLRMQQPDGSFVTVFLQGDESFHYMSTRDGYPLLKGDDGYVRYANFSNGVITPSETVAHNPELRSVVERYYLDNMLADAQMNMKRMRASAVQKSPFVGVTKGFPTTGKIRGLIILANFTDKKFVKTHAEFVKMLNQKGYSNEKSTGSAKDYFMDQSMGVFQPDFDVVGPVQLANKMSYYGKNLAGGAGDAKAYEMIAEACQLAKDSVKFSTYDYDKNDTLDMVFVFYAGYGENNSGAPSYTIWPHKSQLSYWGDCPVIDGKKIDVYACTSELNGASGTELCGIGTFCHEFSHVLGLPDLYQTNGFATPKMGTWDIMDYGAYNNNNRTPPAYCAFARYSLDWLKPDDLTKPNPEYTLRELTTNNVACRLSTDNDKEFYMLECREQKGWDKYQSAKGLMITHIDYDESAWTGNTVNNDDVHPRMYIVTADKSLDYYNRNGDGDLFPGPRNVKDFTDTSNPSAFTYTGTSMDKQLTNIVNKDSLVTFVFMGNHIASLEQQEQDNWSASVSGQILTVKGCNFGDRVFVYTVSGAQIATQVVAAAGVHITLPSTGVYFVQRLTGNNNKLIKKVVCVEQ